MADRKVVLLLKIIASAGGSIDATDSDYSMLNYFCDDRGKRDDTFNRAINSGYITTTFDSMIETSSAHLTDAGRALVGSPKP